MEAVVYSSKIQSVITRRYPYITMLINHNAEGTIALLQAKDCISLRRGQVSFRVSHSGNDNYKAWNEYNVAILRFLNDINDDVRLQQARNRLAQTIWEEHYRIYPYWPRAGESQSATFNLSTADIYDYGGFVIAWACEGEVTITDERPKYNEYIAKFNGRPVLKILSINNNKIKQLEDAARSNFNEAKRKIDSSTKKLTWDCL